MRIEAARFEIPYENLFHGAVSCAPVRRSVIPSPYASMCSFTRVPSASQPAMIASQPPGARMAFVEKLVCAPAPFQSPLIGFAAKLTSTSNSSAMRSRSQRATQSWSPTSTAPRIPTWNSHWPIITSAFVPSMPIPARRQASVCASTMSRPGIFDPPTPQ